MRAAWAPAEGLLLPGGTAGEEGREEARWLWAVMLAEMGLLLGFPWGQVLLAAPAPVPWDIHSGAWHGKWELTAQVRAVALHDARDGTGWRP